MKHVEVVKSVRIGGKLYNNPQAAAKRWVEVAGGKIMDRHAGPWGNWRSNRAWAWYRDHCMVVNGKNQRYWRRVLPIFVKLLT